MLALRLSCYNTHINTTHTVKHFKFTLTDGVEFIPVDIMKDILDNAMINLVNSDTPLGDYCPTNRRQVSQSTGCSPLALAAALTQGTQIMYSIEVVKGSTPCN